MKHLKKPFFRERTVAQIKNLDSSIIQEPGGLTDILMELDADKESLILKLGLTPQSYFKGRNDAHYAGRVHLREGYFIKLDQPRSIESALRDRRTPLRVRQESITQALVKRDESEIFALGYKFRPIVSNERKWIYVPFAVCAEGCRIDSYDLNVCKPQNRDDIGIQVDIYEDAKTVFTRIPSTREDVKAYQLRWKNVCIQNEPITKIKCWGTRPEHEGEINMHELTNFGKSKQGDLAYPQWVAGYQAIIRHFMHEESSYLPLQTSQYAIISRKGAELYFKLKNNVLIKDPSLSSKDQLRKPYWNEVSMLIARATKVLGHNELLYWSAERDGRIKDYPFRLETSA